MVWGYLFVGFFLFVCFLGVKSYLNFLIVVEAGMVSIFLMLNLFQSSSVIKVFILLIAAGGASVGLSLMVLSSSTETGLSIFMGSSVTGF